MNASSESPGSYCWVKLVKAPTLIAAASGDYSAKAGPKPPPKTSAVDEGGTLQSGDPRYFHINPENLVPQAGTEFDIPTTSFTSESGARKWLKSPAGARWAQDALNFTLVALSKGTPETRPYDPPTMTFGKACKGQGIGQFPASDWLKKLFDEFKPVGNGSGTLKLSLLGMPIDDLSQPTPDVLATECDRLVKLIDLRSKGRVAEIRAQAKRVGFVDEFIEIIKTTRQLSAHDAWRLRDVALYVSDQVFIPTFQAKAFFNRARPWNCCGEKINPIFNPADGPDLYPGHPSYPSGHATQAHAVAHVFASVYPTLKNNLLQAAEQIAFNREVAGLHFASDSAAGAWLGEKLHAAILEPADGSKDERWVEFNDDLAELRK